MATDESNCTQEDGPPDAVLALAAEVIHEDKQPWRKQQMSRHWWRIRAPILARAVQRRDLTIKRLRLRLGLHKPEIKQLRDALVAAADVCEETGMDDLLDLINAALDAKPETETADEHI